MNIKTSGILENWVDVEVSPGSKVGDFLIDWGLVDKPAPAPAPVPGLTTTIIQKASPLMSKNVLIAGSVIGGALLLFIAFRQK